jgi:hypothetical protein
VSASDSKGSFGYWFKLGAGIAVLAAIVGVWFGDEYYTKKETEEKKLAEKALNFESDAVRQIGIKGPGGEFSFARDGAKSEWKFVREHAAISPDQDAVNNFLAAVKEMRRERDLPAIEESKAAEFGFDNPRRVVRVSLEGGKEIGLEIGGDVKVGQSQGADFKALSIYARSIETKALFVVPSAALTSTDKKFSDLRTKQVAKFLRDEVAEFSFDAQDGNVTVAKQDANWTIKLSNGKTFAGDGNAIGLYLDKLQRLRADAVIEKTAIDGQDGLATLGLAKPSRIVRLKKAGGETLQEISIGANEAKTNVIMADGAVAQLALDQFGELVADFKTLRDLKVMSGVDFTKVTRLVTSKGKTFQKEGQKWYPVSTDAAAASSPAPRKDQESRSEVATLLSDFEFMRAKDIIDADAVQADPTYGLDQPIESFTFEFADDAPVKKIQVRLGRRVVSDEKSIYLKREGSGAVFMVDTAWMDTLRALDEPPKELKPTGESSPQAKKEN